MTAHPSGVVRWGVFEFDPSTGTLSKHGRELRLPDQPSVALRLLVARAGEVVTREELRAALWPDGTFVDFENGINVAINRIRDALGDSASSPRFIETVPRRGYRFVAPVTRPDHTAVEPVVQAAVQRARWRRPAMWGTAATVVVGLLAMLAARRPQPLALASEPGRVPSVLPRLTRLTAFPGIEQCPALSPDGDQVAFSWTPAKDVPQHVYVTMVGSADRRQVTSGDGSDSHAAWSSDGRYIAFVRHSAEGARLYIVSALGGTARRVGDFPAGGRLAWSPDDRYLLSGRSEAPERGIWAVPVNGGDPRLVIPAPASGGARAVALSPDGRRLAYASCRNVSGDAYLDCDADVVSIDAALAPTGPVERLVTMSTLGGFAWTRDGGSIVFFGDTNGTGESRLCRVHVESRAVETLDAAGLTVGLATTTGANDRLVFVRFELDVDIVAAQAGHASVALLASSADDSMPAYSTDGRQVAFMSARTGPPEVWVADASGANPRQLTHGPGAIQQAPRWSPDGRSLAFESRASDGHTHVWTIGSDGSPLRQLTDGMGDEVAPTWSADGRFVYFGANRGHGFDIWRVPANGGAQERVTTEGSGRVAFEAPDGRGVLYQQKTAPSALLLKPSDGGVPRVVVPCADTSIFTWHRTGIYYVPCGREVDAPVHRFIPGIGRDTRVFTLERLDRFSQGDLALSPDARTILYSRTDNQDRGGDLWMLEPFK